MADSDSIAITGVGAVCGAGALIDTVWEKIQKGETAVGPVETWDLDNWPVKVASEVKESNRDLVPDRKLHKSISRTDLVGLYAAQTAIDSSGIPAYRETLAPDAATTYSDRSGIIVGSGGGNYQSNYDFLPLMAEVDQDLPHFGKELSAMVTPMWLLRNLPNNVLCHSGIQNQWKGYNACITNQCSSGIMSVAEGAGVIRSGHADRITAIGHDAPMEPENILYYHSVGLMSGQAPRPFDQSRDGTIFGEGAGTVILEKLTDAKERGATILGEFLGSGCVSEATGILELKPDGNGVARAIRIALEDAGVSAEEIGMICAHANGTPGSDRSEALGIRSVFGDSIPPVTGFKWCYGHTIAASGILDLIFALEALRNNTVPGIATLETVEEGLEFLPVSASPAKPRSNLALTICRGFGGMNVATVIRAE